MPGAQQCSFVQRGQTKLSRNGRKPYLPKLMGKFYNVNRRKVLGLLVPRPPPSPQGTFFFFCRTVFLYRSILLKALLPWSSPSNSYCYKSVIKDVFSRVWHINNTQTGIAKASQFYHELQNTWQKKRCSCREHQLGKASALGVMRTSDFIWKKKKKAS